MRKVKNVGRCCGLLAGAVACVTVGCAVCTFMHHMAGLCCHMARMEWNALRYSE